MDTQLTVQEELLRFLRILLLGTACGVFFDLMRLLRALLPHGKLAVFLEDALFSFTVCFVLQVDAWSFCGGALCWQHFCGMALGLAVYLLTCGRVTARMLARLRRFRQRIAGLLLRILFRRNEKSEKISESP